MVSGELTLYFDNEFFVHGCVDTYAHKVECMLGPPSSTATRGSINCTYNCSNMHELPGNYQVHYQNHECVTPHSYLSGVDHTQLI